MMNEMTPFVPSSFCRTWWPPRLLAHGYRTGVSLKPTDATEVVVVLVGGLRGLHEVLVVEALPVFLRPSPQSSAGLVNVTVAGPDSPLTKAYSLLLRSGGNAHEGRIQRVVIDPEVGVEEPQEFVVAAVASGGACAPVRRYSGLGHSSFPFCGPGLGVLQHRRGQFFYQHPYYLIFCIDLSSYLL
jgi:hypothetical protein